MIRSLIALVVLAAVLCLTNPSSDRHFKAVQEAMDRKLPENLLGDIVKTTKLIGWEYRNYWFFSTSHIGDRQVSLGFLWMVFVES